MLYTVQNAHGVVFGKFRLPEEVGLSPSQWTTRLNEELEEVLGSNGIREFPLTLDSQTGEQVDRIVIDINPRLEEAVERVHIAVGFIALTTPPEPF